MIGRKRDSLINALAFIQAYLEGVAGEVHRAIRRQSGVEITGIEFHIVDAGRCGRLIARRKEARQGQFNRHLIAHSQRLVARAHPRCRPGHSHKAQLAIEVWDIKADFRFAVPADINHARPERDCFRRHHRQALATQLVTTRADFAWRGHIRVKQSSIIIIKIDAERHFAEIPFRRVWRLEFGEGQNALVNSCQRHEDWLFRTILQFNLDFSGCARTDEVRHFEIHIEDTFGGVDWHIGYANSTARLWLLNRITRREHRHHDIGTLAPLCRDRQTDFSAACADRLIANRQDLIRRDHDLGLTCIWRQQGQLGRAALFRQLFRHIEAHAVWCFNAFRGLATPANPELIAGFLLGFRIGHDQAVIAIIFQRIDRDRTGLAVTHGEAAFVDLFHIARPAPAPAIAILVPIIIVIDLHQSPIDIRRHGLALRADPRDIEFDRFILARAVLELGFDTQIRRLRTVRHNHTVADSPTAWFEHAHHRAEAQRLSGIDAATIRRQRERCIACAVCHLIFELNDFLTEDIIKLAKTIAFEALKRGWVHFHPRFGFDLQTSARRAIEEARCHIHFTGFASQDRCFSVCLDIHPNALRNKIFDRHAGPADFANPVDFHCDAPLAARRRLGEFIVKGYAAQFGLGKGLAGRFHAVRTIDDEPSGAISHRTACIIAQHGGRVDNFTRTVNTTLGIDKAVHGEVRRPTRDILRRQINRCAIKIQNGEITARAKRSNQARTQIAFALHQRAIEMDSARAVIRDFRQNLIVLREELQANIPDLSRRLERAHHHIESCFTPIGSEREVGRDDPALRLCSRPVAAQIFARVLNRNEIGARLKRTDHVLQRKDTDHRRILLRLDIHFS